MRYPLNIIIGRRGNIINTNKCIRTTKTIRHNTFCHIRKNEIRGILIISGIITLTIIHITTTKNIITGTTAKSIVT